MRGLSATDLRKQRISQIAVSIRDIKAKGLILDEDKFLFQIQMNYGITERKAKEYLLTAIKQIDFEDNNVN